MNPLIQLKNNCTTSHPHSHFCLLCAFAERRKQSFRRRTEAIPTSLLQKEPSALQSLTTGSANTAVGWFSLFSNATGQLQHRYRRGVAPFQYRRRQYGFWRGGVIINTTGINNTAVGATALLHNTIAEENTATGAFALSSNTEGDFNTANGAFALWVNTTGERNTATGDSAMFSNTIGNQNTATGNAALGLNTTGRQNTATGAGALFSNATGSGNTASGVSALLSNTDGDFNTAVGLNALFSNTSGIGNTAIGNQTLQSNTTGSINTALGNEPETVSPRPFTSSPSAPQASNVGDSCYIGNIWNQRRSQAVMLIQRANWAQRYPRNASRRRSARWSRPAK